MSRHRFVAEATVDTEGMSPYLAYAEDKQRRASMAAWDKKPGQHKREKAKSFSGLSARDFGHIIIASIKPPTLRH